MSLRGRIVVWISLKMHGIYKNGEKEKKEQKRKSNILISAFHVALYFEFQTVHRAPCTENLAEKIQSIDHIQYIIHLKILSFENISINQSRVFARV